MCLPGREDEFRSTVHSALGLASRLGTTRINILAGIPATSIPSEVSTRTALGNLRRAAELAAKDGVEVLVETSTPPMSPVTGSAPRIKQLESQR